jgi:hypothetical protein
MIDVFLLISGCSALAGGTVLVRRALGWNQWRWEVVIVLTIALFLLAWLCFWAAAQASASV